MRFRKSIKVMGGVRVNFSKSGMSTTIGGRGLSVNIGKKGTYLNTGIPGTGLYDRTRISKKSSPSHSRRKGASAPVPIGDIKVTVSDNGTITLCDMNDIPITNQSLLRKIKQTDAFKNLKMQLTEQIKKDIEKQTDDFIDIYKLSSSVARLADYQATLADLEPNYYEQIPFGIPAPKEEDSRTQLQIEAQQNIKTMAFWKLGQLRQEYINNSLLSHHSNLYSDWETKKAAHEQQQKTIEEQTNVAYKEEYEKVRQSLELAINGNQQFVELEIEKWLSTVELPVEFDIQFEFDSDISCVMLDLDLPEIESIPEKKTVMLANGNIKSKPKTQKELRFDYMRCVYGLAIFFSSYIFNISPAIKEIIVSGFTQRRNKKTGDIQEDYVYSTKFLRPLFEQASYEDIDIFSFWEKFENRCLPTQVYDLKKIVPFEKPSPKTDE